MNKSVFLIHLIRPLFQVEKKNQDLLEIFFFEKYFSILVVSNEPQTLRIESLLPSTLYRVQIVAKSRAGEGSLSIPYQLKTLDRQVPQFKILSSDRSCLNDQSCLIKWIIESDGGSPISRAEISYAKVN